MTTKRFMVDDAGTLIDMQTRDMFDIVEELCPLLNELNERNEQIKHLINEAIETERTELGKSVLRQLKEAIE